MKFRLGTLTKVCAEGATSDPKNEPVDGKERGGCMRNASLQPALRPGPTELSRAVLVDDEGGTGTKKRVHDKAGAFRCSVEKAASKVVVVSKLFFRPPEGGKSGLERSHAVR